MSTFVLVHGSFSGGWVWRQLDKERLTAVTQAELFRLSDLLRAQGSSATEFILTEQMTTDTPHKPRNQRRLRFNEGNFQVEQPDE